MSNDDIQLGQASVNPQDLKCGGGGTSTLQAYAWEAEVPPISSTSLGVHAGLTQLYNIITSQRTEDEARGSLGIHTFLLKA